MPSNLLTLDEMKALIKAQALDASTVSRLEPPEQAMWKQLMGQEAAFGGDGKDPDHLFERTPGQKLAGGAAMAAGAAVPLAMGGVPAGIGAGLTAAKDLMDRNPRMTGLGQFGLGYFAKSLPEPIRLMLEMGGIMTANSSPKGSGPVAQPAAPSSPDGNNITQPMSNQEFYQTTGRPRNLIRQSPLDFLASGAELPGEGWMADPSNLQRGGDLDEADKRRVMFGGVGDGKTAPGDRPYMKPSLRKPKK